MNTYNLIKKLYKEIDEINTEIDMKIEKGLSYKVLSRRHKALIDRLHSIDKPSTLSIGISKAWPKGFMGKLAHYASVFLM
ncbi:MAG TPA: hypothetical protein VJJ28_01220 [Candidatus Paceibacterota bacterium]